MSRRTTALAILTVALVLGTLAGPASGAGRVPPPAQFTFTGSGWGHGVGLSQYGALGMAKAGASASEIVAHYYTGTTVAAVRDDVPIKVNLLHAVPNVMVTGEPLATGGGRIQVKLAGSAPVVLGPGDRLRLRRVGDTVRAILRPASGGKTRLGQAKAATVRWAGTRAPGRAGGAATLLDVAPTLAGLRAAGHRYRYGVLRVVPSLSGGLEAVNAVRVRDEYLPGIAEMPSSWPAAALQAQVIAARSYALSKVADGVRASCRCHVDDGGGPYYDQTFTGYGKVAGAAGDAWVGAVSATAASTTTGLAVLYQGRPIPAFYSSSSGGRTQSSQDVWGGTLPWAQSVADPWSLDPKLSPYASWTRTRSQAEVAAIFKLPDVVRIDLTDRTAGDALATVTATSSAGKTVKVSGPAFAGGLGFLSRWVWGCGAPCTGVDPPTS